ncbi:hypothetical protein ARAM_003182 [Aspergillus rambellii]|uniref:Hcy-binding domain-containing protein n=1 Tax=Aspergillus rambellii TaxID=308745 RepID=A0A0F8V0F9_9EURO|nr:hypothetical protein ARAM_003182 [Aspergillus rambellii]
MPLPHLQPSSRKPFLSECGLETTLVYKHNIALPCFSSTPLLEDPAATALITTYYKAYIAIARSRNTGVILETRTWRASAPWAEPLGYTVAKLMQLNRDAVGLAKRVKQEEEEEESGSGAPILISGALGPLRDAYEDTSASVSVDDARAGYREQALAVVELAREVGLPVAVSFTIESDGCLLGGRTLEGAIRAVDEATQGYAAYFGVNCAHPIRIAEALRRVPGDVASRIALIRGNSSLKSHEELDNSATLDRGDLPVFVSGFAEVLGCLPGVRVLGGCCGTDEEHLGAIAEFIAVD